MKNWMMAALTAFGLLFATNASAELHKCVKDGKTTYQEQPCAGQGAETKSQTSKPSSWVGCYRSMAAFGTGAPSNKEVIELRQDGSMLYSTDGTKDGPYEVRLLWAPASPKQIDTMKQIIVGKEKAEIEVKSGLVVTGASKGPTVNKVPGDQSIMGFWWIRGLEVEGDPMGHQPRTKETLRNSKETLYLFGPWTFDKVAKEPCAPAKAAPEASAAAVQKYFQDAERESELRILASLAGAPVLIEGGRRLVHLLSHGDLVLVDVATGKATKFELSRKYYDLPPDWTTRISQRWFSPDGSLFWSRARELVDLRTGVRVKDVVPYADRQYEPVGFVDHARRFVLFDPQHNHLLILDATTGVTLHDIAVEGYVSPLNGLSHDGRRMAWTRPGALYVLDTAAGKARRIEVAGMTGGFAAFCDDADRVAALDVGERGGGYIVDPATGALSRFESKREEILHFSQAQGLYLLHTVSHPSSTDYSVVRRDATNPAIVRWSADIGPRRFPKVSPDGRRLYAFDYRARRLESADVSALSGHQLPEFQSLSLAIPPGDVQDIAYFLEQGLVVIVQSPKITLVRIDAAGGVSGATVVDLAPFKLKTKKPKGIE